MEQFETGNQLKGYIQRETKEHHISSNAAYNYYFTRSFLQRLYNDDPSKLVLKGSYSQFIRLGKILRPITDIDIVTFSTIDKAEKQINGVISDNKDIKFKIINTFLTTNGTLNYKILCDFDGKTGRISLDLKKEDSADFSEATMPILFSRDKTFETSSISLEEHLSGKILAILLHMLENSNSLNDFRRLKDFYDIYNILGSNNIDCEKTSELLRRKIMQNEYLRDYRLIGNLFDNAFINGNKVKWEQDSINYQFLNDVSLEEVVNTTKEFMCRRK